MTPNKRDWFKTRGISDQRAILVFALVFMACGMRTSMVASSPDASGSGGSPGGAAGAGGGMVNGSGGHTSTGPATGGSTTVPRGGSGGNGFGGSGHGGNGSGGNGFGGSGHGGNGSGGRGSGGSGSGGRSGTGGTTSVFRDAAVTADVRLTADVRVVADAMPGAPTIDPNSGYVTVNAGTVVLSGFVTSSAGGSGSSISLTCTENSFCASGTVGASTTYNSWANTGFNVNQSQSGGSGSTGSLALVGSTISISYVNHGGSRLELELWDSASSSYWCYYLPASTSPTTATVPLSSLNTKCWDGSGTPFVSGTSITMVQMVVPGSATSVTPFDYCFLGLTVQ